MLTGGKNLTQAAAFLATASAMHPDPTKGSLNKAGLCLNTNTQLDEEKRERNGDISYVILKTPSLHPVGKYPLNALIHFLPSLTHFHPSLTHFLPALTHFLPALTHFMPALTHFLPALTHFPPALTQFQPSPTSFPPSATSFPPSPTSCPHPLPSCPHPLPSCPHPLPSLPRLLPALTRSLPTLTHFLPALTHFFPALTYFLPTLFLLGKPFSIFLSIHSRVPHGNVPMRNVHRFPQGKTPVIGRLPGLHTFVGNGKGDAGFRPTTRTTHLCWKWERRCWV